MQKIILASKSPRRKQILELANIPFEVLVVDTDESFPGGLSPEQIAIHIAKNKARAVKKLFKKDGMQWTSDSIILSADTIVVLGDEIIGKPSSKTDAVTILQKLSGQKHSVITGVSIFTNNTETAFTETTDVEFYELTISQIEYYINNYKPYDKAGAYAIQEWIGAVGIKSINGDYYNVMGLPISRVLIELEKLRK